MTTLTKRMIKGHFVVSGPDVEPMKFKTRPEGKETLHPGIADYRGRPRRHTRG